MARRSAWALSDHEPVLYPARLVCPACSSPMRVRDTGRRTLVILSGAAGVRLKIGRCGQAGCVRHHSPFPPEKDAVALPQHEVGLHLVAVVDSVRHRDHRSVPEIRIAPRGREVDIAERSMTNLLDRYDELLAPRRKTSVQRAVAGALPGMPHLLCQCPVLRKMAQPVTEADRHAMKDLMKQVCGARGRSCGGDLRLLRGRA